MPNGTNEKRKKWWDNVLEKASLHDDKYKTNTHDYLKNTFPDGPLAPSGKIRRDAYDLSLDLDKSIEKTHVVAYPGVKPLFGQIPLPPPTEDLWKTRARDFGSAFTAQLGRAIPLLDPIGDWTERGLSKLFQVEPREEILSPPPVPEDAQLWKKFLSTLDPTLQGIRSISDVFSAGAGYGVEQAEKSTAGDVRLPDIMTGEGWSTQLGEEPIFIEEKIKAYLDAGVNPITARMMAQQSLPLLTQILSELPLDFATMGLGPFKAAAKVPGTAMRAADIGATGGRLTPPVPTGSLKEFTEAAHILGKGGPDQAVEALTRAGYGQGQEAIDLVQAAKRGGVLKGGPPQGIFQRQPGLPPDPSPYQMGLPPARGLPAFADFGPSVSELERAASLPKIDSTAYSRIPIPGGQGWAWRPTAMVEGTGLPDMAPPGIQPSPFERAWMPTTQEKAGLDEISRILRQQNEPSVIERPIELPPTTVPEGRIPSPAEIGISWDRPELGKIRAGEVPETGVVGPTRVYPGGVSLGEPQIRAAREAAATRAVDEITGWPGPEEISWAMGARPRPGLEPPAPLGLPPSDPARIIVPDIIDRVPGARDIINQVKDDKKRPIAVKHMERLLEDGQLPLGDRNKLKPGQVNHGKKYIRTAAGITKSKTPGIPDQLDDILSKPIEALEVPPAPAARAAGVPDVPAAVPREPILAKHPIDMTQEEFDDALRRLKDYEDNIEVAILGPERAKEWRRAQAISNSWHASPERVKAADEIIGNIEDSLSKSEYDAMFGVRDENTSWPQTYEELAGFKAAVRMGHPDDTTDFLLGVVGRELYKVQDPSQTFAAIRGNKKIFPPSGKRDIYGGRSAQFVSPAQQEAAIKTQNAIRELLRRDVSADDIFAESYRRLSSEIGEEDAQYLLRDWIDLAERGGFRALPAPARAGDVPRAPAARIAAGEIELATKVKEFEAANPGKKFWYHGGAEIDETVSTSGMIESGWLTPDLDEALGYSEGFVHLVDDVAVKSAVKSGILSIEGIYRIIDEPIPLTRSFQADVGVSREIPFTKETLDIQERMRRLLTAERSAAPGADVPVTPAPAARAGEPISPPVSFSPEQTGTIGNSSFNLQDETTRLLEVYGNVPIEEIPLQDRIRARFLENMTEGMGTGKVETQSPGELRLLDEHMDSKRQKLLTAGNAGQPVSADDILLLESYEAAKNTGIDNIPGFNKRSQELHDELDDAIKKGDTKQAQRTVEKINEEAPARSAIGEVDSKADKTGKIENDIRDTIDKAENVETNNFHDAAKNIDTNNMPSDLIKKINDVRSLIEQLKDTFGSVAADKKTWAGTSAMSKIGKAATAQNLLAQKGRNMLTRYEGTMKLIESNLFDFVGEGNNLFVKMGLGQLRRGLDPQKKALVFNSEDLGTISRKPAVSKGTSKEEWVKHDFNRHKTEKPGPLILLFRALHNEIDPVMERELVRALNLHNTDPHWNAAFQLHDEGWSMSQHTLGARREVIPAGQKNAVEARAIEILDSVGITRQYEGDTLEILMSRLRKELDDKRINSEGRVTNNIQGEKGFYKLPAWNWIVGGGRTSTSRHGTMSAGNKKYRIQAYNELRTQTDLESFQRIEFDASVIKKQKQGFIEKEYFHRGWKSREEGDLEGMNDVVENYIKIFTATPKFRRHRNKATFMSMMDIGFEPWFIDPFQMAAMSTRMGIKHRLEFMLRESMLQHGIAKKVTSATDINLINKDLPNREKWRVPSNSRIFDGESTTIRNPEGADVVVNDRYAVPQKIATTMEALFKAGDRPNRFMKYADQAIYIPKRLKLFGSLFQVYDFASRIGGGTFGKAIDSILQSLLMGKPLNIDDITDARYALVRSFNVYNAYFNPGYRKHLRKKLNSSEEVVPNSGITWSFLRSHGLSVQDRTILPNVEEFINAINETADRLPKKMKRYAVELEYVSRRAMFDGAYPAAIMSDVESNILPMVLKEFPNATPAEIAITVAERANTSYSTLLRSQSEIQGMAHEVGSRLLFSINENEGLIRQVTNIRHLLTPGRRAEGRYWLSRQIGSLFYILFVSNLIHMSTTLATEGRPSPLPLNRYIPIRKAMNWMGWGYSTKFARPDIPFDSLSGNRNTFDTLAQLDNVARLGEIVTDPGKVGFSRTNALPRGVLNAAFGKDLFYDKKTDEWGWAGRVLQAIYDVAAPIGMGEAGLGAARLKWGDKAVPSWIPGVSGTENRPVTLGDILPGQDPSVGYGGLAASLPGFNINAPGISELEKSMINNAFPTGVFLRAGEPIEIDDSKRLYEQPQEVKSGVIKSADNEVYTEEIARRTTERARMGDPYAGFRVKRNKLFKAKQEKQTQLEEEIDKMIRGDIPWDPDPIIDHIRKMDNDYGVAIEQLEYELLQDPDVGPLLDEWWKPKTEEELLIQKANDPIGWAKYRYQEIIDSNKAGELVGSAIDWKKVRRDWEDEQETWNSDLVALYSSYQTQTKGQNDTPYVQAYKQEMQYLRDSGYWEAGKESPLINRLISLRGNYLKKEWEKWLWANSSVRKKIEDGPHGQAIKAFAKERTLARERLRKQDPKIDRIIIKWFKSVPQVQSNMSYYIHGSKESVTNNEGMVIEGPWSGYKVSPGKYKEIW